MTTNTGAIPDMSVPDALLKGTELLKVSDKKEKRALFRIDADQGQIEYESSKSGKIPIEAIKEIRAGPDATYYRAQFKLPEKLDGRWITIIYTLEGTYKTIHLVAETVELYNTWLTTLRRLHAIRQGLMTGLGNIALRDTLWERQYWKGADKGGDSKLDFGEVEGLCKRLSVRLTDADLKKAFQEADKDKLGYLDFEGFRRFVRLIKRRPDLERIYNSLGKLDLATFSKFLLETQKSTSDAQTLFSRYSPNDAVMTLDAFSIFLMSNDNSAFSELHEPIWQDMSRPISEYYVSSSHNTYLVGHQLVGVSTIEGYIRALLHSCRSVEMDIYDGKDGEPVVYHGKTMTSAVSVRDLCAAIAKYAFVTSPYAIIISAEVHCGLKQQDTIVNIMVEAFGDRLIKAPVEGRPELKELPSPDALKGKILLKAKDLMVTQKMAKEKEKAMADAKIEATHEDTSSDSDSSASSILDSIKDKWRSARKKEKKEKRPLMSISLATLLVYTVGVKCLGLNKSQTYAPEHIFSLSESRAAREAGMDMVVHCQSHMVRVYPKGTRLNSTNYQPQGYWAMGAQVVAINWQTFDLGYMINQAMFQRNGRCGYILKPQALRPGGEKLLQARTKHRLELTIISAQQLPRAKDKDTGEEIIERSTIDPMVQVALHIPDWMASPVSDAKSGDPITKVCDETKEVKDNGFNPVWDHVLKLPFECVGDMMDLIFMEVSIKDHGEFEGAVAKYCIPLGRLGRGYRYLPLHDDQMSQYLFATLFVKVDLVDL